MATPAIGGTPRGFMHGVTRANRSKGALLACSVSPTRAVAPVGEGRRGTIN